MKFHCLLPVRDEADIIGQCLEQLLTWADKILIFDTGSIDNTWEIVQEYASKNKKIIALKKDHVYFSESRLRSYLFHIARQDMTDGDWFLRVDADEFHHISPVEFVKERLHKHETIAYHQYYNFEITESEAANLSTYEANLEERKKPITERRRYYTVSVYSEPRLCRYRSTMQWPETISYPYNAGFVARERLPIRHYRFRDPLQMEHSTRLRAAMLSDKENDLSWTNKEVFHWANDDWRKFVVQDDMPELKFWQPGTALQEVKQFNHLAPFFKRAVQRIIHGAFLPLMDRQRTSFSESSYPQKISPENIQKHTEFILAPSGLITKDKSLQL
jgi:glycosyltransferase involved in cell wall biosynthesis